MRLNPDCVRDIMLALEDTIMIDEYGNTIEVDYRDVPNLEKLSSYDNAEVLYTLRQLLENGLLSKGSKYIIDCMPRIKDISSDGYKFLDAVRKDSAWQKIKSTIISCGKFTVQAIVSAAIEKMMG